MSEQAYDSRPETYEHIQRVRQLMLAVAKQLIDRAHEHDLSKLEEPELSLFNEFTPKLAETDYGTPEYQAFLVEMGPALAHHYRNNPHHPEYFELGIHGMDLVALLEMLCDWIAAGRRHASGGDIHASIEQNAKRFGYGDELKNVFLATVDRVLLPLEKP